MVWPLLLSLGGGFLIFFGIFSGEHALVLAAGVAAVVVGALIAGAMRAPGAIVALVLSAVGAFGGWVWVQFHDEAWIGAVAVGPGDWQTGDPVNLEGSTYVGRVTNHEERTATLTCQLVALSPEGDVIGTADVTFVDVPPNRGRQFEGEIDPSGVTEAGVQVQDLRGTCTAEISS